MDFKNFDKKHPSTSRLTQKTKKNWYEKKEFKIIKLHFIFYKQKTYLINQKLNNMSNLDSTSILYKITISVFVINRKTNFLKNF